MKLATFERDGRQRLGAVIDAGRRIVDLDAAFVRQQDRVEPALSSMLALIDAGAAGRAVADAVVADPPDEDVVDSAAVRLLAPLPQPRQIRDFLCFEEHLRNAFAQAARLSGRTMDIPPVWYEQPIYYKANRFSVVPARPGWGDRPAPAVQRRSDRPAGSIDRRPPPACVSTVQILRSHPLLAPAFGHRESWREARNPRLLRGREPRMVNTRARCCQGSA